MFPRDDCSAYLSMLRGQTGIINTTTTTTTSTTTTMTTTYHSMLLGQTGIITEGLLPRGPILLWLDQFLYKKIEALYHLG